MRTRSLCTGIVLLLGLYTTANNIQVANISLVENTGTTAKVQFDVSWENSWRGGGVANWDAAWVFVKFKFSNGLWRHAQLSGSGHTAPGGSTIELGLAQPANAHDPSSNPVIGIFIRRDAEGTGTFTANGVQLLWDYSAQGIIAQNDIAEVKVFAVEMVYVNEGAFFLGSGGDEPAHFNVSGVSNNPYRVTSENAITSGSTAPIGQFYLWASDYIEAGSIPAAFPKGFAASYAMKYEISQQQYTDFLNTLTRQQQQAMVYSPLPTGPTLQTYAMHTSSSILYFNALIFNDWGPNPTGPVPITTGYRWKAMNYLGWQKLTGYLDWSGLRPMTELEYEKLCRGPLPSMPLEYAWGNTLLHFPSHEQSAGWTITDNGTATEQLVSYLSSEGNMNARFDQPTNSGPLRVGIFAGNPNSSGRTSAGAGYFGAMELSGNVFEGVVTIANAGGRDYTGVHGNGELTTGGHADASGWPSSATDGGAWRGGSFYRFDSTYEIDDHNTSSRKRCGGEAPVLQSLGGRGVRTAP